MKAKIKDWIEKWKGRGYSDGIPEEAPHRLEAHGKAPSYRMVCIAIMKNDRALETLGYSRIKCPAYMDIKKEELKRNGKIEPEKQRRLI